MYSVTEHGGGPRFRPTPEYECRFTPTTLRWAVTPSSHQHRLRGRFWCAVRPDTAAEAFLAAGLQRASLRPVTLSVSTANRSSSQVEGAFFARIVGVSPHGDAVECRSMVYVSSAVRDVYLSPSTMLSLGIVGEDFPAVGIADTQPQRGDASTGVTCETSAQNAIRELGAGCVHQSDSSSDPCSCPHSQRTEPPPSSLAHSSHSPRLWRTTVA